MKKTLFLIAAAAAAAVARAQAPAAPAPSPAAPEASATPNPSFPAQVEVVTVDVVVTDKKGAPVTGLKKEDFVVTEDDDPQNISSFEAVELPAVASPVTPTRPRMSTNLDRETQTGRSFVILFDDIHLSPFSAQRAKAAVAQFLRTGVREGDRVSLVA